MQKPVKLPSGSWNVRVYLGKDANGKRIIKSVTAPTKKEVERLAANLELDHEFESAAPLTFKSAADAHIEARRGVLSPYTVASYTRIVNHDLEPLHDVPVSGLTAPRVQAFISDFALDHSPKTVRNVCALISSILRDAAPDLRLTVRLPQPRPHEIGIPAREDIDRLIAAADPDLSLAISLAAMLGLRRSEICALTWSDIQGDRLRVSRALAKGADNQWSVKTPKSSAGHRTLRIPPPLLPKLRRPAGASPSDRLIPLNPDNITHRFVRLCRREHMDYTFHSLRHYYASVMLALGVPDKYAMARMGHSTPDMLKRVYQHLMADKDAELDTIIGNYFSTQNSTQNSTQPAPDRVPAPSKANH